MRWAVVLILMGCTTPSPQFFGSEAREIRAAGHEFTLYRKGRDVQLIRKGMASKAERSRILPLLPGVIEAATDCKVLPSSLSGDAGVLRARLRC